MLNLLDKDAHKGSPYKEIRHYIKTDDLSFIENNNYSEDTS